MTIYYGDSKKVNGYQGMVRGNERGEDEQEEYRGFLGQ